MYKIKNIYDIKYIFKKSIFYTKVYNVKSLVEIKDLLNNIKLEYKNANHYCYAYIINSKQKYSDDKEPFNTGKALLDILIKNNINNTLCIVIRYFGGIKLGSSLKSAYTKGLLQIVNNNLEEIKDYITTNITFKYDYESTIINILKDSNIIDKTYTEDITYKIQIDSKNYTDIIKKLNNYIIKK